MAQLVSVNVGKPETINAKVGISGINKHSQSQPVWIGPEGLEGDAIIDREHHGGVDQAVYVYLSRDYDWWVEQLGHAIAPGTFGENLTICGIDGETLAIGDRFGIGAVVLEVTGHRTPCNTFAAQMGDAKFPKRFHQAGRPGAYCRVIVPGAVSAGQAVDYVPFAGPHVTVAEMMALDGVRDIAETMLRRALATPIHHATRSDYEALLAQKSSENTL